MSLNDFGVSKFYFCKWFKTSEFRGIEVSASRERYGYMNAFCIDFGWTMKGDHSPRISFMVIIANRKFEIQYYDTRHEKLGE